MDDPKTKLRMAAREAFENEPPDREKAREAYLKRFAKAFKMFDKLGMTDPSQARARVSHDRDAANDMRLGSNLDVLLSPVDKMRLLKAVSAKAFDDQLDGDKAKIQANFTKDGNSRTVDDYIKEHPPSMTRAQASNVRVLWHEHSFQSGEAQPERVKATREITLRFDQMPDKFQTKIKENLAKAGVDPDKALAAMEWSSPRAVKTPRLTMQFSMVTEENHQYQDVRVTPKGEMKENPAFGAQIDREPSDAQMLEWAAKPDRHGVLPSVKNNEFMTSYKERMGPNAESPPIHNVLAAPEGQYTERETALAKREAANGVKAQQSGLVNGTNETIAWAAINVVASRTLGEEPDVTRYSRRQPRTSDDVGGGGGSGGGPGGGAVPPGSVTVYAGGESVKKERGKVVVPKQPAWLGTDVGSAPRFSRMIVGERVRPRERDAEGQKVPQKRLPESTKEKEVVSQMADNRRRDFAAQRRWVEGKGWPRSGGGVGDIGDVGGR